jgi:mRNA interferase RelE/StbE
LFRIVVSARAKKELRRLPDSVYPRVRSKLLALVDNPRPEGCGKLADSTNRYRIRVGNWRILYSIDDVNREVVVHRIAPRGKAYR